MNFHRQAVSGSLTRSQRRLFSFRSRRHRHSLYVSFRVILYQTQNLEKNAKSGLQHQLPCLLVGGWGGLRRQNLRQWKTRRGHRVPLLAYLKRTGRRIHPLTIPLLLLGERSTVLATIDHDKWVKIFTSLSFTLSRATLNHLSKDGLEDDG